MTQIPDWSNHVGPGWQSILTQLHTDIVALDPDYEVGQVKEKFGSLRVYLTYRNLAVEPIIRAAEILSETTCEDCGRPGLIRHRRNRTRLLCLCDACVETDPQR